MCGLGSVLSGLPTSLLAFTNGCSAVLVGHCTRNDCAPAGAASRQIKAASAPRTKPVLFM
jgi:hypothetical protein